MNKRQRKKHLKKALILSIISIELAEKYVRRYRVKETYSFGIWVSALKRSKKNERKATRTLRKVIKESQ